MPEFKTAAEVEQICYEMRLSDYSRGMNRARINDLFNGFPPYSEEEVKENQIEVNVNFLEPTVLAHDARAQFYGAFLKPGNYFGMHTDRGPAHKRAEIGNKVTNKLNRILKRSLPYYECFRSKFAVTALHGVGPAIYRDSDEWCPDPKGMEDVLVPARTYLHMRNLPFFALYHSFTAVELMKLTRGPQVDPGWNMKMVDACIDWIDKETMQLMGSNWPEVWAPEKAAERVKGDGGFYVGDQAPTIDCWDFYFYDESGGKSGWKRKMILDSWAMPGAAGQGQALAMTRKAGIYDNRDTRAEFLYEQKGGFFADDWKQVVGFIFADLSAVGPFQYHSIRSLGFLLYAICHLQNRLRCKFTESVFEALMMYFRVKTMDDVQRALKLNLINRGFIDDTITIVPQEQRYNVNENLVQLGLETNTELIARHASSYRPEKDYSQDKREKTATQVMSEANATASLASVALQQMYHYQDFEYYEIVRRFMKKNSRDPDVKKFQAACLSDGVPEKYLVAEAWEVEAERIMGAGNKTLETAIANQLMAWRDKYDPEAQRKILYDATLALTDDAAKAEMLVPEDQHQITNSIHDAQLSAAALMMGLPVAIKSGMNHIEYVQTLMADMAIIIQKAGGGMGSPDQIQGLMNMGQHIAQHIQLIAQDQQEKELAKAESDKLGKLMNLVKAMAQKLQQHMKAQQKQQGQGNGQADAAKIQATIMNAKVKAKNTRESHAQRTVQRDLQFEQQMKHDSQKHQLEIQTQAAKTRLELQADAAKTRAEIQNNRLKAANQPKPDES